NGSFIQPLNIDAVFALTGSQIIDPEISHYGCEISLRSFFIVEVNRDQGVSNLADSNIPEIEILKQAASRGIILDAESMIKIGAIYFAVLGKNVSYTARDLAADRYTAVPIFHFAAPDDHVFGRDTDTTAVVIAARFDRDAIVACIEMAILDQDIFAAFGV